MAKLVLKRWRISDLETGDDEGFVDIAGRQSGLIAWLLALCGIDPTTSFNATHEGITFRSTSLSGSNLVFIAYDCVSSVSWGYFKPWKSAAIIFILMLMPSSGCLTAMFSGVGSDALSLPGIGDMFMGFVAGALLAAAVALLYYFLNRLLTIQVAEIAGAAYSIQFKRSVIESIDVDAKQAERVYEVVRELMRRSAAGARGGGGGGGAGSGGGGSGGGEPSSSARRKAPIAPPVWRPKSVTPAPQDHEPPPVPLEIGAPADIDVEDDPDSLPSVDREARAASLYRAAKELALQGKRDAAIAALKEVARAYPGTKAAEKARKHVQGR